MLFYCKNKKNDTTPEKKFHFIQNSLIPYTDKLEEICGSRFNNASSEEIGNANKVKEHEALWW
jgi:hypothetical protein